MGEPGIKLLSQQVNRSTKNRRLGQGVIRAIDFYVDNSDLVRLFHFLTAFSDFTTSIKYGFDLIMHLIFQVEAVFYKYFLSCDAVLS